MTGESIEIRRERPGDIPAIRSINQEAFDYPFEADLVDALRRDGAHVLSMVAVKDGKVAGHILFSPVTIEEDSETFEIVGLAPMAIYPRLQRSGIGSALIRASLDILKEEGVCAVVLLGHPAYYPKFGFRPASQFGIRYDYKVPDESFMILELQEGVLKDHPGVAKYHDDFIEVQLGERDD